MDEAMEHIHTKGDGIEGAVYLSDLLKRFPTWRLICLKLDRLWVLQSPDDFHIDLHFLEFHHSMEDKGIAVTTLMTVQGPSGNLREMRHTNIGENGYVFYLSRKNFEVSFEHCSKYFDME